jgi:hypothetical protein
MAENFGDKVWDLLAEQDYATGLQRAAKMHERIIAIGDDKYLPDPRVVRKQVRYLAGALGLAQNANEVMEEDPSHGKFKLTYEITTCPFDKHWRELGLNSELRQKLCRCMGWASDMAALDYFGIWIYEDQGLAKQCNSCKFIMYGPKSKKEHQGWGDQLPEKQKKYFVDWHYCK